MKRNTKIFVATAITLVVLIVIAYVMVGFGSRPSLKENTGGACVEVKLKLGAADAKNIDELISTMANKSAWHLLMNSNHMHKLGDEIDKNVPPFEFLGYIFSHPKLAKDMATIKGPRNGSMKYSHFVEGLRKNMLKEDAAGCYMQRAKSFATALKLKSEQTTEMLDILQKCLVSAKTTQDKYAYKPFVDYLIKVKSPSVAAAKGTPSGKPMTPPKKSASPKAAAAT